MKLYVNEHSTPKEVFLFALQNERPCKEYEYILFKSPYWLVEYAKYVIRQPWREAEATIATDPVAATRYFHLVLNANTRLSETFDRWKEAEDTIRKDPICAAWYRERTGIWEDDELIPNYTIEEIEAHIYQ